MSEYTYSSAEACHTEGYLWDPVFKVLSERFPSPQTTKIIDVGCGNAAFTAQLASRGFDVVGVDTSESGISIARNKYPGLSVHIGSGYDDLQSIYGCFDAVVSLEVIEHLYSPREFMHNVRKLLRPGGIAIISTPFHGYFKNLVLALTGQMDKHFTVLWDHGHIKFWSVKTLSSLLGEFGMVDLDFKFAGRFPLLAKSMIVVARNPAE